MQTMTTGSSVPPASLVSESSALDAIIGAITESCRQRAQLQQAKLRLDNQIGALERIITGQMAAKKTKAKTLFVISPASRQAAGMTRPVLDGLSKVLHKEIGPIERAIATRASDLPVAAWIKSVRGVGILGLGLIIGETGDLALYDSPAQVWKRMGLAVMPDGQRQRRVKGEEGNYHGFSPRRRALMFVIGDCLIKQNQTGVYRTLYDDRKALELARLPKAKGVNGHAHARASRYMQKRFLRDLWRAWRDSAHA